MNYLNRNRFIEVSSEIIEYDIRSANVSVMKHYKLAPLETITRIEALTKEKRVREVGLMMKNDKDFSKALEKGFNDIVDDFISMNSLVIDDDILSIKRDAVFVINKQLQYTQLGEHIHFIKKNIYKDYLYCKPYEIYRNKDGLTIKGMNKDIFNKCKNGMLIFFNELLSTCADCNMRKYEINDFMKDFVNYYKKRLLDLDYYRELNSGLFNVNITGESYKMNMISLQRLEDVDISYNYINIILPLIRNIC